MSLHRYAKRRDLSEPDIVTALERIGALVERLDEPCDLLVKFRGVVYLGECKTPGIGRPSKKLNAKQAEFCRDWNVPYWLTPEDALRSIGAIGGAREVDFNVSPIYVPVI